jgi:alkylation response protein AidB-like acyl-CoA dehydrogenase
MPVTSMCAASALAAQSRSMMVALAMPPAFGILGIGVPVEYGGLPDSDFRHSVVVTEEAQRLFFALGGLRVHTDICLPYFLHFG